MIAGWGMTPMEALMAELGFFVKPGHSDKCHLQPAGREEFVVYEGSTHALKRNGHKGGSTMWHRFRCNCIDCDAVAYVRWDVLVFFIAGLSNASKETQRGLEPETWEHHPSLGAARVRAATQAKTEDSNG